LRAVGVEGLRSQNLAQLPLGDLRGAFVPFFPLSKEGLFD
jgi:hypothetical protein